ncbi:MAG: DUF4920 domain-containing protein [Ekhidna sp.]
MKIFYIALFAALVVSCNTPEKQYQSFGNEISSEKVENLSTLLASVDENESTFKVKGVVEEVCQMKGCWMTLKNEDGASVRITFKDYGFFVPKNISGKEVILEGVAFKEMLEEDVAKHYAEDGGLEYDESMRDQISFVASGVLVAQN